MEFERSSHGCSWLFDTESLSLCRQEKRAAGASADGTARVPRKFASGFDRRIKSSQKSDQAATSTKRQNDMLNTSPVLTELDEETLIRFHANQIQALVGPRAIYREMRRSPNVLATAIMLFKRFYLSNSVLDFQCRDIAVASALLASKVEPDERIQAGFLSYATQYIHRKAQTSSHTLYASELRAVSVEEIEAAERAILEGTNYELICFHPTDTVRALSLDLVAFLSNSKDGYVSDNAVALGEDIYTRAMAVCYRALVGTDAMFLFSPEQIAFCAISLALCSIRCEGMTGKEMEVFLRFQYPSMSCEELETLERKVASIELFLKRCPPMELDPPSTRKSWNEAEEVWSVLTKLANIHSFTPPLSKDDEAEMTTTSSRKRRRYESKVPAKVSSSGWTMNGCPKVTPSVY